VDGSENKIRHVVESGREKPGSANEHLDALIRDLAKSIQNATVTNQRDQ